MTLLEDLNDLLTSGDKLTPDEYESFRIRVEEAKEAGRVSGNVNYPRLVSEAFARVVLFTENFTKSPEEFSPTPQIRVNESEPETVQDSPISVV